MATVKVKRLSKNQRALAVSSSKKPTIQLPGDGKNPPEPHEPVPRCSLCKKGGPGTYAAMPDGSLAHLACRDEHFRRLVAEGMDPNAVPIGVKL